MTNQDIETAIAHFTHKQRLLRASFIVLLVAATLASIGILMHFHRRTMQAEQGEQQQKDLADAAAKSLETIASDTLNKVEELDQQAVLIGSKYPTLYLWRRGLHPRVPSDQSSRDIDFRLASILHERRFLLGVCRE